MEKASKRKNVLRGKRSEKDIDEDESVAIVAGVAGVLIIILVGWMLIQRMNDDFDVVESFCEDKKGVWEMTGLKVYKDIGIVNCSDNESYGLVLEVS